MGDVRVAHVLSVAHHSASGLHVENGQLAYYQEGKEKNAVDFRHTPLTAWFQLNIEDENARQYYYMEIPEHYVWYVTQRRWRPRQQGGATMIGRMYMVNVLDRERFYLRLLLLHVKGATGFEDLRRVGDTVHRTFQEAARARSLLLNDMSSDYACRRRRTWLCRHSCGSCLSL